LPETFAPYSASLFLDEIQAPIQIYHGTNDESVPYDRSLDTLAVLEQAGKEVELITYP
jgi:dipeptidyl aminopeptidase/acylaminoacyl peptidase